MLNFLLNYMEDYQIEYLKEQYTEEVINLLEIEREKVILNIEKMLTENPEADIYLELSMNLDQFI